MHVVHVQTNDVHVHVYMYPFSSEEWSSQQQDCVQCLHGGVEGVMSLLRQFSQEQTRVGRERSSAMQDSLTHCQTSTKQFQVTVY